MPRKGSLLSRLAALGLLLLCIVLVVMLGVVPIVREYQAYDGIIADARDQLADYAARRKDTRQLQAQLTRIRAKGRTQETYLREKTPSLAAAALLGRIKSTVQQHKGTLSSAQILSAPEKADNPKVTVRAHLRPDPVSLGAEAPFPVSIDRSDLNGEQAHAAFRVKFRPSAGIQVAEIGKSRLPNGPPAASDAIEQARGSVTLPSPPNDNNDTALITTIRDLLATPEDRIDLARAKLTIDALVDPNIDVDAQLARLDDMERGIRASLPAEATDIQKLEAVRRFIYDSGPWNDHRPFQYDLDDPLGTRLSNKLLGNYLETRRGNCITMPFLFIILADRLGLDVAAATAPLHVFVKFRDGASGTTYNLETTSGALPARDAHYRKNLPMTDAAIANGVYMRALAKTEAVAVMAMLAAEHALAEDQHETAIAVADLALERYPSYAYAMLKKGSAYFRLMKRDFFSRYPSADKIPPAERARFEQLSHNNRLAFRQAEALGWREAPMTPDRPAGQTADKREGK